MPTPPHCCECESPSLASAPTAPHVNGAVGADVQNDKPETCFGASSRGCWRANNRPGSRRTARKGGEESERVVAKQQEREETNKTLVQIHKFIDMSNATQEVIM